MRLNDSTKIDLPKLIETRLLVQANSGGGKSWLLRRLLEQSHGKVQQIVIDPEGEFGTLREKFDYVLAGKGGDTPADPRSAALLAKRLLELRASAIIDLYELPPQDRKRFVRLFLDAMVNAPKELYHEVLVVIDEAHIFVPEKEQSEAASAVIDLCTRGRKRGYCAVLATQRISKLAKDAAAECNNKLIGRTGLDIDMKRAGEELGFTSKEQMLSLRKLQPGEFYAFGPAISDEVKLERIGNVSTSHPKVGSRNFSHVPPPTSAIKKLLAQLADLPAEAEQEIKTVSDLKKENAQLKRELTLSKRPVAEKVIEYTQQPDTIQRKHLKKVSDVLQKAVETVNSLLGQPAKESGQTLHDVVRSDLTHESLPGPKQRILNALAWLESVGIVQAEKAQLALLAEQSPTSSGYTNNLGSMRSGGLINYPSSGMIALTDAGRGLAESSERPPTTEALQREVLSRLPRPKVRILEALIAAYPESLDKEALALRSNQSITSSGYTNNLGSLRTLGLVEYPQPGYVRARDILFL